MPGVTPVFPLTTGSPVLSGYYGVRRSFLSDSDFHGSKPLPGDAHSPSAVKPFACEPAAAQGPGVLPEPGLAEPFADPRALAPGPGPGPGPGPAALFGPAPLPPLLPPPFAGDPAHFVLRDSWEQTLLPDAFSQPDPVPTEALQTLPPSASCLSPLESVSSTQHRSASWGASLSGTQPYSLHTLEDLHHAPGYPTPPPYPFAPFMTMSNDLLPKGLSLSPDEGTDASSLHDPSPWTKDDGSMAWGSYECRRAY
ncbi:POU domain class 2-associating factor 2 [Cavia porcellus]|uniref:POU domain class 2-associating factor 2 n=1 Tax=Cavia porcellus TaxID=10141 RepID=UPI002FE148A5